MPYAPHSNTETRLWRALSSEYGQRFNAVRFMNLCRLARFHFNVACDQAALMQNFQSTWCNFLHNAVSMHEFDWCLRLIEILKEEVRLSVPLPKSCPTERSNYFRINLTKWFGKCLGCRDQVSRRLAVMRAAKLAGVSPLSLLLDHDLVDITVLSKV